MSGFFTTSEITKKTEKKIDPDQLAPDCLKCKLYKQCASPKIKITGEGRKEILIISEFPSNEDDQYNTTLIGGEGKILQDELKKISISLNRDCWKMHSVSCKPPDGRMPSHKEIKCCHPKVEKAIRTLKPKLILLLGNIAITTLFGEDFSNRTIDRWRSYEIPDEKSKCYVMCLHAPYQLLKNEKDKNLKSVFQRDIKRVSHCLKLTYEKQTNYEKYVTILRDFNAVKDVLKRILKRKQTIAFDYETTGLKPFRAGHKIVTIGVAVSATKAFAFPFNYKSYWTDQEFSEIKRLWKEILRDKGIKKIVQNGKFEDVWSTIQCGARPKGLYWDTMMCSHIMDNRRASTGLKFQTFINYGVRPYDKIISSFLKSKNGEFNTVEKAPFKELLIYNGLDCIFTWMRYKDQKRYLPHMKNMFKAYKFFMRGTQTMAAIQLNGINVDTEYFEKTDKELAVRIDDLKKYLVSGREAKKFKGQFHRDIKIGSNQDLGKLFYEVLGKNPIMTENGNYKTDKATLEKLNLPFVDKLSEMKRLEKAKGTYLAQFARETCKGKIHPFWDLHIPVSYRSCIAGYEKVLVMRDFESHPEGVPIKDIKIGDYVYCFDDDLNPAIKKVLWQGKTGHKEIIRVHYYRKGGHDHFDCTPEHKVRLINGEYVEAQNLLKTQHYEKNTVKDGNCRALACARKKDALTFTSKNILEHRLIYKNFIGELSDDEIVHHKDKNHLNHYPINLEKHTKSSHAKLHVIDTLCSKKSRQNNIKIVRENWKKGKYDHTIKRGKDNPRYVEYSKRDCLNMLHSCCGMPKKTVDKYGIDFGCFKRSIETHEIDWKTIKLQYDKTGKFISKNRLLKLSKLGRSEVKTILGHNHYKLLELYKYYGIDTKRKWGNQFGEFKPGNHLITKVEWIKKTVDVYDIEIEEHHNFFVNEICVHNSSSMPNFQNLPKRDPEIGNLIRTGIVPRLGGVISEIDFSGAEVSVSLCYHHDPQFKHDITVGDMHRDLAIELFMLTFDLMDKNNSKYNKDQISCIKKIRFFAKNGWTFAQFYGDWFGSCAPNLWESVVESGLKLPNGITVKEHLEEKGIYELGEMIDGRPTEGSFLEHCKEVEERMWNERFPMYTQWKKDIVEFYQKHGFIENYFGFRFQGYMDSKQCTNFPIQSASFHLLVYTLIKIEQFIKKNNLKALICGQVHDSAILDIPKDEIEFVINGVSKIVKSLQKKFKWLTLPMEIEIELSRLKEYGGNFAEMQEFSLKDINNGKYKSYLTNS